VRNPEKTGGLTADLAKCRKLNLQAKTSTRDSPAVKCKRLRSDLFGVAIQKKKGDCNRTYAKTRIISEAYM